LSVRSIRLFVRSFRITGGNITHKHKKNTRKCKKDTKKKKKKKRKKKKAEEEKKGLAVQLNST